MDPLEHALWSEVAALMAGVLPSLRALASALALALFALAGALARPPARRRVVTHRGVSLLSLFFLASSPAVVRAQDPAAEEARIRKQLTGWVEAWNQGDAEAITSYYAENAVRTFPHGMVRTGKDQIHGLYREAFTASLPEGIEQKLAMTVLSVRQLRPDVAVVDYEFRATGIPILPELEVTGRTTLVMVKQGGEWLRSVQSNWIPTTPDCFRLCARE